MATTLELYVTYSIKSPRGLAVGRNTVTLISATKPSVLLSMADIRKIEEQELKIARKAVPDATGLHLTWWTEIRPSISPTSEN